MQVLRTTAVAEKEQYAYWHDVICRHFVPAHSRQERPSSFPATFTTAGLGAFQLGRLSAPRHAWSRTARDVRAAPHDEYLLSLKLAGHCVLGQDSREASLAAGEFALYDTGSPFSYLLDADIAILKVPRHELEARLPGAHRFTAVAFGKRSSLGRLAARAVTDALTIDATLQPQAAVHLGSGLLDLACAALQSELGGATMGSLPHRVLLQSVKAFASRRLGDPSLDAATLAGAHGISVRTLNRLFQRDGTTPMRWLWGERLRACHAALGSGAASRVTDVALRHGFSDPSHFSRAFRAAFGETPREFARGRTRA